MNLNEMTVGQLQQLVAVVQNAQAAELHQGVWEIGKVYLIRTVTMIDTGRLVAVTPHELVLEDAAWIADTGRFAQAVADAKFNEVEPFPEGRVIIGRGAIVDAVQIDNAPRKQQ